MLKISPTPHSIRVEIEVRAELLSALERMRGVAPLSNTERFEIAALTFIAARALSANRRSTI
jgi:hypothetical protein